MINVLLVDDHELVRAGIRRILEDIKGIKVAGEACCGEDAVKWCRANSADVVLMDDDPAKIALAMRIARRTLRIVYQNIVFALAIKFACLVLGALGLASMWTAIFADVGVMVLAVLNATRALYTKDLAKKNAQ